MSYGLGGPLFEAELTQALYHPESASLHNGAGQAQYFLGEVRSTGWWYYYPVALAVKLPAVLLLLIAIGLVLLAVPRNAGQPPGLRSILVCAILILAACMSARLDIGMRLVLHVVALLVLIAGVAVEYALRKGIWTRIGLSFLMLWFCVDSMLAHPNYLSYFNELSRAHPEQILIDTDLDWGQDLLRLADRLHQLKIDRPGVIYFGSADFDRMGFRNWHRLAVDETATGYVAVSKTAYYFSKAENSWPYSWISRYHPVETVGTSIYLFRIPND